MGRARFAWIMLSLCLAAPVYGDDIYVDDVYIYEDGADSDNSVDSAIPVETRPKIKPPSAKAPVKAVTAKAPATPPSSFRKPSYDWRVPLYDRVISLGLEVAHRLRYAYTSPGGASMNWASGDAGDITWFFGFNARVFLGNNWGIGLEGLVMDFDTVKGDYSYPYTSYGGYHTWLGMPGYETTIIKWLCDIDLLYRYALTPRLLVNAGAGITMDARTWDTKSFSGDDVDSGVEVGNIGYNFKFGVEYFIGETYSITVDWKRQHWGTGVGSEKYSISSVVVGVSMSY
jgi:hypothetical protein